MTSSEPFDVIIIGGGPAGAAAAITLGRRHFRIAIIERSAYCTPRVGETLPPAIRSLLTSLGVWQHFLADAHVESFAIRLAWGGPDPIETNHIYNPYGSGWHVDRACFDRMLAVTAANVGAILLTESHIKRLSQDQGAGWEIDVLQDKQSRCIRAPFLIDATGRTSANPTWLPRSFNIMDRLIGVLYIYPLVAEPYTLIEAEPRGWWYSAPLPHGRLIVVHMTDADLFASAGYNLRDYWQRQLSEATLTYRRTGTRDALIEPKVVSAASVIRRPVCGTDWLAVGDACIAFDPLSGLGVYNALRGGILAAEAIIARFDGNRESFAEYAGWVNSQFSNYLQTRRIIYSKEQRWAQYPFWRRRHEKHF
jgi:flavin-dependent dehydrogenase